MQVVRTLRWHIPDKVFGVVPFEFIFGPRLPSHVWPLMPDRRYSHARRILHAASRPVRWLLWRCVLEPVQLVSLALPPRLWPWRHRSVVNKDFFHSSAMLARDCKGSEGWQVHRAVVAAQHDEHAVSVCVCVNTNVCQAPADASFLFCEASHATICHNAACAFKL